jgi:transposase
MASKRSSASSLKPIPMLLHETLYVGVDIAKSRHVAGFVSTTLLTRHKRFESCPALSFEQSREGFRSLLERIREYVPLTQVQVLLEVTGHYHKSLVQYLQELDIPVYLMHVQKRQAGLLKSDKRDALGLANHLYNALEKGVQTADPFQAVRHLVPPTEAAVQLRGMVHHRQELIVEQTRRKNKLTAICDEVFPELTQIYKDPNSPSALALRSAFPTPAAVATASLSSLLSTRKARRPSEAKLAELQRLAIESIGTKDAARLRGLIFEQHQLVAELQVIQHHIEALDMEMSQVIAHSREGQILTSIPGVGSIAAAIIIGMIGNIANFDRPAQLKAYCGWAPSISQSGATLDHAKLTPRGVRLLKQTVYLVAWNTLRPADNEFARLYGRLVRRKCIYDDKTGQYVGKNTVIGRVAGQLLSVIFTLLKRDQERIAKGGKLPDPELYDPAIHHRHRTGQYSAPTRTSLGTVVQLPTQ